jgi:GNAT superfamily N-acetyltransferase
MNIRKALKIDVEAMCVADHIATMDQERRQFIRESVRGDFAYVAVDEGQVVGYAVLEHSFFTRGFIAMLMVHHDHRRFGIGSGLIHHVENLCESDRIFVSTNESNLPMQALLVKVGYIRSGYVDDLDPGDPEIFYSRQLREVDNNASMRTESTRSAHLNKYG